MVRNSSNTVVSSAGGSGGSATIVSSTLSSVGTTSKSSKLAASLSVNGSPSFARRRALKEADDTANQLRVLDCYPLSKYIAIADTLFGYFEEAFDSLKLDDAYVYGMRFAELAITNLPAHPEWGTAAPAGIAEATQLQARIVKVVSRLEIIKRRMDEEESRKLRTGMLAQAEARMEEEGRRQQQVHRERREQEQLNTLIPAVIGEVEQCPIPQHIETTRTLTQHTEEEQLSDDEGSNNNIGTTDVVASTEKSPKSNKLRQFLRLPHKVGLLSWSSQPHHEVSQPIVPSPDAIKQSQAQHWQ